MPSTDEFVAEVTERGRVTIPRELRAALGVDDAVRFVRASDGEVCLRPADRRPDDGDADPGDPHERRRSDSTASIQS